MTKATLIGTSFNWNWLTGSEAESIIIKVGAWQCLGRHGAGAEGKQEKTGFQAARRVSKPTPTVTHFSSKDTPPNKCHSLGHI